MTAQSDLYLMSCVYIFLLHTMKSQTTTKTTTIFRNVEKKINPTHFSITVNKYFVKKKSIEREGEGGERAFGIKKWGFKFRKASKNYRLPII